MAYNIVRLWFFVWLGVPGMATGPNDFQLDALNLRARNSMLGTQASVSSRTSA